MKNVVYGLSLIAYTMLSYFYFVERDFSIAFYSWISLLIVTLLFKPFREQTPLLLLIGLCFCFLNLLNRVSPWLQWPLDFYLVALFGFGILRFGIRRPVEKLKWSFSFSRHELISIFAVNIPATVILVWYYSSHPEVAKMWPVPKLPLWEIPFVVLLIAGLNGLREEILYRGLLQTASSQKSPAWFVIGLQAVLFGFLHFMNAFPQGWLGVFLTAIWGGAIALQYRIFKSISLSWVTHAMVDAIMFGIIIYTRS